MSESIRRLRNEADKYRLKGLHDKARDAYLELCRLEPDNPRWPHLAADQERILGRLNEAADLFADAARRYAARGLGVQAVAMAKLARECVPAHEGAREVLRKLARSSQEPVALMARRNLPTVERLSIEALEGPADAARSRGSRQSSQTLDGIRLREVVRSSQELPAVSNEAPPVEDVASRARAIQEAKTEASMVRAVSAFEIPILDEELVLDSGPKPPPIPPRARGLARPVTKPTLEQKEVALKTPLFGDLDPQSLDTLVASMKVLEVREGEYVVRQGEQGAELYVVVDGELEVIRKEANRPRPVLVGKLGPGDFFGEIAIVTAMPRQASVRASTHATLLEIGQDLVVRLIQEHPSVVRVLLRFFMRRMVDILVRTSPLFKDLDESLQASLLEDFRFLEVEPGVRFIVQGRPLPGLFVMLAGSADVVVVDSRGRRVLARLGPADVVGETALLSGRKAVASVESTSKCWMIFMPAKAFRQKAVLIPSVVSYLTRLWNERLQAATAPKHEKVSFPVERLDLV